MKPKKLILFGLAALVIGVLSGCASDNETSDPATAEKVSFKGLTRAWFEQAPEDKPPTPNGIEFEFDADEDPDAFNEFVTPTHSGVEDV